MSLENFVIGPVDVGNKFTLGYVDTKNNFYVLDSYPDTSGGRHYFLNSGSVSGGQASYAPVGLTASGSPSSVQISDVAGGGLSYNSTTHLIGNAVQGIQIKPLQNLYVDWGTPALFLSGVQYALQSTDGKTLYLEYGDSVSNAQANATANNFFEATGLFILPETFYFNCSANGAGQLNQNISQTAISAWCVLNSANANCSGVQTSGYTSQSDCATGVVYTYCTLTDYCSSGNCKGPCSKSYDSCFYKDGKFACEFNIHNIVAEQWWKSWWFLALVIGFSLLVIIAFIILIIFLTKKKHS